MLEKALPSPLSLRNVVALLKSPIEEQNKPSLVRGAGWGEGQDCFVVQNIAYPIEIKTRRCVSVYLGVVVLRV